MLHMSELTCCIFRLSNVIYMYNLYVTLIMYNLCVTRYNLYVTMLIMFNLCVTMYNLCVTYNVQFVCDYEQSLEFSYHHVTTCFNNHYEFISIYRFNLTVPYRRKILSAQFPSTLAWFWLCIWRMKYKVQYTSTYSTFKELSSLGLIQPFWNDTKLILVGLVSIYI